MVLLSVTVDNMLKIDLLDVWPTAFSLEDIFLMEKKGSEQQRAFFLEEALTASGGHWDFSSFFAFYLLKPLQGAFGGETEVRGWSLKLVEKVGCVGIPQCQL